MAKNPNKAWTKGQTVQTKATYTIVGGVLNGYTILNPSGEPVSTHEKMWDAINERERLKGHGHD